LAATASLLLLVPVLNLVVLPAAVVGLTRWLLARERRTSGGLRPAACKTGGGP